MNFSLACEVLFPHLPIRNRKQPLLHCGQTSKEMGYPDTGRANLATVTSEAVGTGASSFIRLSDTSDPITGRFAAIKAINGNAVLSAGIEVSDGDSLEEGDVVLHGDVIFGPFVTVTPPDSGEILVYLYPSRLNEE